MITKSLYRYIAMQNLLVIRIINKLTFRRVSIPMWQPNVCTASWGPYWVHVKSGWDRRDHPNMCIMFYDKMKRNPKPEYRKLATFLGSNPTDEQLDKVRESVVQKFILH